MTEELSLPDGDLEKAQAYHATLATLIHDLRGPVARVKAVAELLREEIAGAPANSPEANRAVEWLMIINRATDNIDDVLENMLEAARYAVTAIPSQPATRENGETSHTGGSPSAGEGGPGS